jgi:hypothetical protein
MPLSPVAPTAQRHRNGCARSRGVMVLAYPPFDRLCVACLFFGGVHFGHGPCRPWYSAGRAIDQSSIGTFGCDLPVGFSASVTCSRPASAAASFRGSEGDAISRG